MMTMLTKCMTGIQGFDEISGGGLPQGRPTLVCGSPGCGKTLLGMEFLFVAHWSMASLVFSFLLRKLKRN